MPRFSVVTPVHDPSVDGLRACADSVLGQSHSDWEWVISDDASSDAEVVAYLDELARDQRVTLIRREVNGGIVAATNDALRVATGEFVAFLDHDDLLTPDALSAVDEVLLGDDSIDFLYSDEDKIDDDGNRRSSDGDEIVVAPGTWTGSGDAVVDLLGKSITLRSSDGPDATVIDGQGLGLWDEMVQPEFDLGALVPISDIWLEDAGYYIVFPAPSLKSAAGEFLQWLKQEASSSK